MNHFGRQSHKFLAVRISADTVKQTALRHCRTANLAQSFNLTYIVFSGLEIFPEIFGNLFFYSKARWDEGDRPFNDLNHLCY